MRPWSFPQYRIRCIDALFLSGIASTELVHSKDGYITYDDYKSVADPGGGGRGARASPFIFKPPEVRRAEKNFLGV